jgi:hypothetical protein
VGECANELRLAGPGMRGGVNLEDIADSAQMNPDSWRSRADSRSADVRIDGRGSRD